MQCKPDKHREEPSSAHHKMNLKFKPSDSDSVCVPAKSIYLQYVGKVVSKQYLIFPTRNYRMLGTLPTAAKTNIDSYLFWCSVGVLFEPYNRNKEKETKESLG